MIVERFLASKVTALVLVTWAAEHFIASEAGVLVLVSEANLLA